MMSDKNSLDDGTRSSTMRPLTADDSLSMLLSAIESMSHCCILADESLSVSM